jgi:hypothetical protein
MATAPQAAAAQSRKKSMWGPVEVNGVSQFPIYRDLGVGIYETALAWDEVATLRPVRPGDPADPAYVWPAALDRAVAESRRFGIQMSVMLFGAPAWANGGKGPRTPPLRASDFATFARAASRRYPSIHHWMVWGEPSRRGNFTATVAATGDRPLNRRQRRGPETYARLLDAAYGQLKARSRSNLVIGGNTFTTGDVSPLNWMRYMRLPDGRPPRMDLYGHNPFTIRPPDLSRPPLGNGFADFSDLDTLWRWSDRYLSRAGRNRKPLRIFVSEFLIPTDHANFEFNFFTSRAVQATWLRDALRITRRSKRIYTLGWLSLYDDPPRADGLEVNRGLIDVSGARKPSYEAFRAG